MVMVVMVIVWLLRTAVGEAVAVGGGLVGEGCVEVGAGDAV
jgi:hypothetical protein